MPGPASIRRSGDPNPTEHGLTPQAYRERWELGREYPMVAPSYAATRSGLAKQAGLGRKRGGAAAGEAVQADAEVAPEAPAAEPGTAEVEPRPAVADAGTAAPAVTGRGRRRAAASVAPRPDPDAAATPAPVRGRGRRRVQGAAAG